MYEYVGISSAVLSTCLRILQHMCTGSRLAYEYEYVLVGRRFFCRNVLYSHFNEQ